MAQSAPLREQRPCRIVIAIDGPAAVGKSTVLAELARQLNALPFDTGVVYRALAWAAQQSGISLDDESRLTSFAEQLQLELRREEASNGLAVRVVVNGQDISEVVRAPELGEAASRVAAYPGVRAALLALQRAIAASAERVVIAGRDIGTVVVPEATLKIWLDASLDERVRRRYHELQQRGKAVTLAEVERDLLQRDQRDASRAAAPMQRATDAIVIQTDGRSVQDIVQQILLLAKERARCADAARTV
jgi:cytidylate kinase